MKFDFDLAGILGLLIFGAIIAAPVVVVISVIGFVLMGEKFVPIQNMIVIGGIGIWWSLVLIACSTWATKHLISAFCKK